MRYMICSWLRRFYGRQTPISLKKRSEFPPRGRAPVFVGR